MPLLDVVTSGPYNVLYVSAFAVGLWLAWGEGRRRNLPTGPWLALLAAVALGGVAGSKALRFDLVVGEIGEKTVLGALLGGLLALHAGRRFLRLDLGALDALVPAVPAAVAIGRIGCFLAGCCHGLPATVPWAVASTDHPGALVHPAPLYEAAAVLLLVAVLSRLRPALRNPGSLSLAFGVGYGALRLVFEFWRCGGPDALGMRVAQWSMAGATLVGATLLWRRERSARRRSSALDSARSSVSRTAALIAVVLVTTALGAAWLTPLEAVAILFVTAVALAANLPTFGPGRRPATACGVAALLLAGPPPATESPFPRSYVTVGGSAMGGSYQETCGGSHDYGAVGFSAGYTRETSPNTSYSVRIQAFTGEDTEDAGVFRMPLRGIAVKGSVDSKYVGLTLGGTFGDLVFDGEEHHSFLVAGLRFGSLSKVFLEGRLADHEPSGFPGPLVQVGIGGRISKTGSTARLGLSDTGVYVTANFVTSSGFELEPFLSYGDSQFYNFGLVVRKRFGKGARPVMD